MKLLPIFLPIDNSFSKRQYMLGGRGATLIWAVLEAIASRDGRRGEVILPDILCPSVLEAVLAAGFIPRFAEVDSETFCLTPQTVRPLLSQDTSAVIVVHIFGYVAPIEELVSLLDETNVYIIEDAVQAIGGMLSSAKPVGSCGDFSFISFDSSKIIRGQGAILFYDDEIWTDFLYSALSHVSRVEETASEQLLNVGWRDLYHGLGQALRQGKMQAKEAAPVFRSMLIKVRPLLFRAFDSRPENIGIIWDSWNTLSQRIKNRNTNALALQQAFDGLPIHCPAVRMGDAIWRYTVEFPNRETADRFIVAFRDQGGLVSHLYYSLHQLFQPDLQLSTHELSARLVNLWVDETVNESYLRLVQSTAQALF